MSNYEIMVILNPKVEARIAHNLVEEIFGKESIAKEERLDTTDLAYPINKSLKGQFVVFEVKSSSDKIFEFSRKANIHKDIWRHLVINLDTEKGKDKVFKAKKGFKNIKDFKKPNAFNSKTVKVDNPKNVANEKTVKKATSTAKETKVEK
ncbi:30S ribosomal protein S6 [Mycoplasmopsis hyopharyngis]|uniref:30S ribosomal protein S6 n=1 Tax=Mycoplasmopsis hyopharyngis TaxID=29558 RepID=UPI00387322E6